MTLEQKRQQLEWNREYYYRNQEKILKRRAELRALDPERARARGRRWWARHPERIMEAVHKRRAVIAGCKINDFSDADWREVLVKHDYHCAYCGVRGGKLTRDHVIPLSRGGNNTKSNIVPACRSCNSKKGVRSSFVMGQKA